MLKYDYFSTHVYLQYKSLTYITSARPFLFWDFKTFYITCLHCNFSRVIVRKEHDELYTLIVFQTHLFDKPYLHVSSTELELFALASWANKWEFYYPTSYHFVLIITLCCGTEGKDILILRKYNAMAKHFLRRPLRFHWQVLKGVHPLQRLLAVLSTFVCQIITKEYSFHFHVWWKPRVPYC